jgi:hypothetical protein
LRVVMMPGLLRHSSTPHLSILLTLSCHISINSNLRLHISNHNKKQLTELHTIHSFQYRSLEYTTNIFLDTKAPISNTRSKNHTAKGDRHVSIISARV